MSTLPTSSDYHPNPVIQQLMAVITTAPAGTMVEDLRDFLYEAVKEYPAIKPMLQSMFKWDNKEVVVALLEEALARAKKLETAERVANAFESGKHEGYSREREYILGQLGCGGNM